MMRKVEFVASVLPNAHLLRGEQVELVSSLDDSRLLHARRRTVVHTSVTPTIAGLRDVDIEDVLNEAVEVVVAIRQLVSLELVVRQELEVVREDEVRGRVLCPHQHVSHSAVLRPPWPLPSVASTHGLPLETGWAY